VAVQVTRDVIEASWQVKLNVRVCVSDMNPGNQDMWKHVGISSKRDHITNFIEHPCVPDQRLYFMADTPHLLKNVRNCLLGQDILLPQSIVDSASLPSQKVSIHHVGTLVQLQADRELKFAPQLKQCHVEPGKYQKMRVNMAAAVLSHTTASALRFCASVDLLPRDVLTTAWFLDSVNRWFDSMNSRCIKASLFRSSSEKLDSLKHMVQLMKSVHFTGRDSWKPIQSGILLSTTTVLDLYNELVETGNYSFLMTGRLTQDCVENLFSSIRGKGDAHPSPVLFRHNLRLISLSQYMSIVPASSYDTGDGTYFLDFLKSQPRRASEPPAVCDPEDCCFIQQHAFSKWQAMNNVDANVLYLLAGWSTHREKQKLSSCTECLSAMCGDARDAPPEVALTAEKSYSGLTYPSSAIYAAVQVAEELFRCHQSSLLTMANVENYLRQEFDRHFDSSNFPQCHVAVRSVVSRFFRLRLHIYSKHLTETFSAQQKNEGIQHGSRSAYCRTKIQ